MIRSRRPIWQMYPQTWMIWGIVVFSPILIGASALTGSDSNKFVATLALLGGAALLAASIWYVLLPVQTNGQVRTASERFGPYKPTRFVLIVVGSFIAVLLLFAAASALGGR